jgi:CubicO group peptidase (beta-lactamase class C family)
LVEAVDPKKRTLDRFAAEEVFKPLGMKDTAYNPPADWKPRVAPTEKREGRWMRGEVHDPRAYAMGGVAGHAGLFSTAQDLARYCRMLLNGGELDGARILSPKAIELTSTPQPLPDGTGVRSYGFDVKTGYSQPLGERFTPMKSFGHTGFTGTC